jgi:transcriptional regulator with XRE-family HTH domain
MQESALHDRLRDVVGQRSYRLLGEITGVNAETARRYMNGAAPSVEFLAAICEKFGINGEWLLTGRGPVYLKDAKQHALQHASAGELLQSLSRAMERLTDRVDRLEVFVQTLETRLWARLQESAERVGGGGGGAVAAGGNSSGSQRHVQQAFQTPDQQGRPQPEPSGDGPGQARVRRGGGAGDGPLADTSARAGWITDAVPERPPADAP